MEDDLAYAQAALDRSAAGLLLQFDYRPNSSTDADNRELEYWVPECSGEIRLKLQNYTEDEVKDTDPPAIHVIYLEKILDASNHSVGGAFCYWDSAQLPVVLISESLNLPGSLAHELGHVFGLNGSAMKESGGHTNNIHGFDPSNMMGGHSSGPSGNRELFTLGQVYRMHFDPRSWLWQQNSGPPEPFRCCQGSPYTHDPCPALWLAAWDVKDPTIAIPDLKDEDFEQMDCPGGTSP